MEPVISRIARDPLAYLSEISLVTLLNFLRGYSARLSMWGCEYSDTGLSLAFNDWISEKYGASRSYHDAAGILESYSVSGEDAYRKFIQEFDEFSVDQLATRAREQTPAVGEPRMPVRTFKEVLADMRKRPPIYIGVATFRGAAACLLGHVRAGQDLNLPAEDGETEFLEFQKWVERKRNKGLPRSWYQLVLFHSATDCNHNERGAFNVFYDWYDQFRKERNENA